jgi:CheY-like chemotaxis protein
MGVLVVDDDEEIRGTIVDLLEMEGYAVRAVEDGAQALAAVEAELPCAVLLDMRMPVLDGWGFAAALRMRGVRVPIAVMTAAVDARRWSDEIGGDAYLAKPFTLEAVLATVERFCEPESATAASPPRQREERDSRGSRPVEPPSTPAPPPQETVAAARALVHRLANELSLVAGYVELLAPHVGSDGVAMLAEAEQASHAAEQFAVRLARLLASSDQGDEDASPPPDGASNLRPDAR